MCVRADHLYGVRVRHDSRYGRLSMPPSPPPPPNGTERHSKFVCPCLLIQSAVPGAKGNGPTLEPKFGEYSSSDTGSSGKPCLVLFDPLLAVCKAWRWPDLASGEWIRRLNLCEAGTHVDDDDEQEEDGGGSRDVSVNRLCINPHHWSRVILTDGAGNLSRIRGNQCVQHGDRNSSSVDLRFEDDPDLICVGVTATQAVKLCQSRSTPGSFDLSDVAQSDRDRRVGPGSAAAGVSDETEAPYSQPRGNMALPLSTVCTAPPSPSALVETWHSEPSSPPGRSPFGDLRHSGSDKPQLLRSLFCRTVPSRCTQQTVRITNSSGTSSSGEADCVTDSTELFDSSFDRSGENVSDCCYYYNYSQSAVNARHSSTSTSGTEEFPARSQPKKPRPLSPTHRGPRPCVPVTSTTVATKPWAKLSFWEETRHVGQSWFSLTDPLVRVIYDLGERECHNPCAPSNTSKTRSNLQQPFGRRRRGGDSFGVAESRGTHCIRLSRLVNRHRCGLSSSVSKLNTSWIHSYQLSQCTACTDHSPFLPDKQTSTTQGPRFATSSWSQLAPSAKRSSSWRQCFRLGNQGITFHLTRTGRVWIDNQTLAANLPLFVSSSFFIRNATSPSCDWPVYRVPAGCSILVFDRLAYQNARVHTSPSESVLSDNVLPLRHHHHHDPDCAHHAPVVHVSLGKGWGPSYRRPDLTHCPARLELWINVEHLCTVAARALPNAC